jgi:hypothetical protein
MVDESVYVNNLCFVRLLEGLQSSLFGVRSGVLKPEASLASSFIGSPGPSPKAGRQSGPALRRRQSCLGKTLIRPASICDAASQSLRLHRHQVPVAICPRSILRREGSGLSDSIRKQEQLVSRVELHGRIRVLGIGEYS